MPGADVRTRCRTRGDCAPCEAAALADDAAFDDLAMRIHAGQRASNPVLRAFWDAAPGGEPAAWHEIPPVPAAAFRDIAIVSGTPERVFRTSGTTGGGGRRGEHHVLSLDLYRAAARANYRHHLMEGGKSLRILSLIPRPHDLPDSSLSTMAGFIASEPGIAGATWAVHPQDGVDVAAVRTTAEAGEPILVLATAFALVHLLDALRGDSVPLPRRVPHDGDRRLQGPRGGGGPRDALSPGGGGHGRSVFPHRKRVRDDGAALPGV